MGYQYRSYSANSASLPPLNPSRPSLTRHTSSSSDSIDGTDPGSDIEDEKAALTSDIASIKANLTEEVKLVLVVNDSLKMAKGKIAAQAGHATLACALMIREVNPKVNFVPSKKVLFKLMLRIVISKMATAGVGNYQTDSYDTL